jgi:hypothetical protein
VELLLLTKHQELAEQVEAKKVAEQELTLRVVQQKAVAARALA